MQSHAASSRFISSTEWWRRSFRWALRFGTRRVGEDWRAPILSRNLKNAPSAYFAVLVFERRIPAYANSEATPAPRGVTWRMFKPLIKSRKSLQA
jgi:hypothetical protein